MIRGCEEKLIIYLQKVTRNTKFLHCNTKSIDKTNLNAYTRIRICERLVFIMGRLECAKDAIPTI